jgi:hypothetical protein
MAAQEEGRKPAWLEEYEARRAAAEDGEASDATEKPQALDGNDLNPAPEPPFAVDPLEETPVARGTPDVAEPSGPATPSQDDSDPLRSIRFARTVDRGIGTGNPTALGRCSCLGVTGGTRHHAHS